MFLFRNPCTVDIKLDDEDTRATVDIPQDDKTQKLYLFVDNDVVKGNVTVNMLPGKKVEHGGIKIELVGQIELFYDRGRHYSFLSLVNELAPPGELSESKTYPFEFLNVEKNHDSYNGINVRLRYFLRASIIRSFNTNIQKDLDFWVYNYPKSPEINNTIKMEVGIEDCLHIEFEYNRAKYHLRDVIIGKVYFLLVRVKIKHMELQLVRRESTGSGPNLYNESETLTKFEIMDGAPVRGESIPVRLFLGAFDLTPTYRNVHSKFSLRYFLNLVLVDEDDRRYFKQQEVLLWRKAPKKLKNKASGKLTQQYNKAESSSETHNESSPEVTPTASPVLTNNSDNGKNEE